MSYNVAGLIYLVKHQRQVHLCCIVIEKFAKPAICLLCRENKNTDIGRTIKVLWYVKQPDMNFGMGSLTVHMHLSFRFNKEISNRAKHFKDDESGHV